MTRSASQLLLVALFTSSIVSIGHSPLRSVRAAAPYCDESLADVWCDLLRGASAPLRASNYPGIAGGVDPTRAFVINSNDVAVFPPGQHVPGGFAPLGGQLATFIVGNGTLLIENLSSSNEVGLAGHVFLCDDAHLVVRNATFRLAQQYEYQYFLWAADRSRVEFEGVILTTLSQSTLNLNPAEHGNSWWWFRGSSSLQTRALNNGLPHGIQGLRPGDDVIQLAAMDDALVHVRDHDIFMETYIAGRAAFYLDRCQYFDTFFMACAGNTLDFSAGLPALCSLLTECNRAGHPPSNFSIGSPQVPYSYSFTDSKCFSWAAEVRTGATAIVDNVPVDANFALGLGVDSPAQYVGRVASNLGTFPAQPATIGPFNATHDIQLGANAAVVAIHLWFDSDNVDVELKEGSVVGDALGTGANLSITARETKFEYGQTIVASGNVFAIHASIMDARLRVDTGSWFVASGNSSMSPTTTLAGGSVALYDSPLPASPIAWLMGPNISRACVAGITSLPFTGNATMVTLDLNSTQLSLDVYAYFTCFDQMQDLISAYPGAPTAGLYIRDLESHVLTRLATVLPNVLNTRLIEQFNASGFSPGSYALELRLDVPALDAVSHQGFNSSRPVIVIIDSAAGTTAVAGLSTGTQVPRATANISTATSAAGMTAGAGLSTGTQVTLTSTADISTATSDLSVSPASRMEQSCCALAITVFFALFVKPNL